MKTKEKPTRHFKIMAALLLVAALGFGLTIVGRGKSYGPWRAYRGGGHSKHGFARMCTHGRRADEMLALSEPILRLTPPQKEAWRKLRAGVRSADEKIKATCAEAMEAARPATAAARLVQFERMTAGLLTALRHVRPAFNAFYTSLDAGQKKALDMMSARHPR